MKHFIIMIISLIVSVMLGVTPGAVMSAECQPMKITPIQLSCDTSGRCQQSELPALITVDDIPIVNGLACVTTLSWVKISLSIIDDPIFSRSLDAEEIKQRNFYPILSRTYYR